jgi:hypothetical protein
MSRLGQVGNLPYQAVTQGTAPINAQQYQGIGNLNNYAMSAQPAISTAEGMATAAAQPITSADINQYMSPYTADVVNSTQQAFANQNAIQQENVQGSAISQGALGGNREAVAQGVLAGQQQAAQAPVIAGLENQGYTTGLNTALTEQQALASGAYGLGNLGVSGENAALTGANAQIGAGSLEQNTEQQALNALYAQQMQQQAFPYQQASWLAGNETGVGSQMGGTSTTTPPPPSYVSDIAGLGMLGSGLFGSTGAVSGLGSLGAGALAFLATGGAVPSHGGIANHRPHTVPETHATLVAQQKQLIAGHRKAQMFPHGTRELSLPHGMQRTETENGVFHHNPHQVSADHVRLLSAHGHEHELLGLGPVSKAEAMARVHRGEIPIAVVERQPDGTEVRAAGGTHITAPHQIAAMERTKSPGNHVRVEHLHHVIAHRLGRANGGVVGYDGGGGVAGLPYGNASGYIPGATSFPHGNNTPKPPSPPQQPSLQDQAKAISQLTNGLLGKNSTPNNAVGQPMGILPSAQPSFSPTPAASIMPSGASALDLGASGLYRRGGGVRGYDDGGFVDDLPPSGVLAGSDSGLFNPNSMYGGVGDDTVPLPRKAPIFAELGDSGAGTGGITPSDFQNAGYPVPSDDASVPLPPERPTGIVPSVPDNDGDIIPVSDTIPPSRMPTGVSALPAASMPTSGVAPATTSGVDLGSNSKLWPALMAAGLGMLSSRSPYAAVGIGEGGLRGLETYQNEVQQEKAEKLKQSEIDRAVAKLSNESNIAQKKLALETEELGLKKTAPIKMTNALGSDFMVVRDPNSPTGYRKLDPNSFTAPNTAAGRELAPSAPKPEPTIEAEGGLPPTSAPTAGGRDEEFLKTLQEQDPNLAATVRAIADYDTDPYRATSLRGDQRTKVLGLVQRYDPNYSAVQYAPRAAAMKEFMTGGPNSPAGSITSGNTAIQHLGQLAELSSKIGGTNDAWVLTQPLNWWNANVESWKNNPTLRQYHDMMGRYAEEATKFYRGIGGSESDVKRDIDNLTAAQSPESRAAALQQEAHAMYSKINAMQDRWKTAMGGVGNWEHAMRRAGVNDFPIIQKKSQDSLGTIDNLYRNRGLAVEAQPATTAPAPGKYIYNPATKKLEPVQ